MNRYTRFTNFDVFVIARELDEILANGTINNIYEIEDLLLIKINTFTLGKKNLIIKNDSRLNLTNFNYPIPKYPRQNIISFRKFLKNRKILSVSQHNFDRIVIFEIRNLEGKPWKLVFELFNKGNVILMDDENYVKIAKSYKKFKDRDVLPNKEYIFPQLKGKSFINLAKDEFGDLIQKEDTEIVRALARKINISGLYSEEICYRANIDKTSKVNELATEEIAMLFNAFKNLRNQLLFGKIDAQILVDNNKQEFCVVPFELEKFKNCNRRKFTTFNEAIDSYFSKIDSDNLNVPPDRDINKKLKAQQKILQNQKDYLDDLKKKKEKYYSFGEFIYTNFNTLEELVETIKKARSKGYSWEEINNRLSLAKTEDDSTLSFFEKIVPASNQLIISINSNKVHLDLRKSIGENANILYEKGKKAEKKIQGTIPAMETTKKNIEKLLTEKNSIEESIDFLIKKPKSKWYEKFHWFFSTEGFLIIGGRDASSNEMIFKKHIEPGDLVFHTNFHGSPLAVIKKIENKEIPDSTLQETADFVASFSQAWKEVWGVAEVFYINPNQISKSPPSGEFLPKGSFMITGKKNFINDAKTELTIGLQMIPVTSSDSNVEVLYPKVIIGPHSAIISQTDIHLKLRPLKSGKSKGKIAKEIKDRFLKKSGETNKKFIKLLSLDDIILVLPSGNSMIQDG